MPKIKYINIVSILIVILPLLISCTGTSVNNSTTNPSQIPVNYTTYSETGIFSISYPGNWEPGPTVTISADLKKSLIDNLKSGALIPMDDQTYLFGANSTSGPGYSFPRISVYVFPEKWDIDTLIGLTKQNPKKEVVSKSSIVVNERNVVLFESKDLGTSPKTNFHSLDLLITSGKNVWNATCTAYVEDYPQWSEDFNIMVRSFKLGR